MRLFCADLTATQTAEVTKINRNTVNRILQILRAKILKLTEEESYFDAEEIKSDERYFRIERVHRRRIRVNDVNLPLSESK